MNFIEKFEKTNTIKTIIKNHPYILICQEGSFTIKSQIEFKNYLKKVNLKVKRIKKSLFVKVIQFSTLKNINNLINSSITIIFSKYHLTYNALEILKKFNNKLNLFLIYKNNEFYYDIHLKNLKSFNFKLNNLELYYFYYYFFNRYYNNMSK